MDILLIKENATKSIELINKINSKSSNMRIYRIITKLSDCFSVLEKHHIDIIIIDEKLFKDITIKEFSKIYEKIKFLIIISKCSTIKKDKKCIYLSENKIVENLNEIMKSTFENNDNIRKFILEELKFIGYNPSYYGTKYLIECIYYIYKNFDIYEESTISEIYPILAKKYNKSINNIKCSITRATSIMFSECEENKLKSYLGTFTIPKTGSKVIIQTIINKLNEL